MKALILYRSHYGNTRQVAETLAGEMKKLGHAAGMLQEKAQKLKLNVFPQPLRCLVQGAKGPLREGETEKAAQFAREFVEAIEKKQA
jgi:menaquinone-dependent protoporphyrinogen IX oxidase